MSAENSDDILQNADQLFDENKFQEAVEILKKHPVRFVSLVIFFGCQKECAFYTLRVEGDQV